jgi:hypothetical protein
VTGLDARGRRLRAALAAVLVRDNAPELIAIPPSSSMTFLASAYASWHRAQAAKDAGGSNTPAGRFIRTLAIVAARSSSTSFTRRSVRCSVAAGRRTTWPTTGCQAPAAMSYGGRSAGLGSTGGEGRSRGAFPRCTRL